VNLSTIPITFPSHRNSGSAFLAAEAYQQGFVRSRFQIVIYPKLQGFLTELAMTYTKDRVDRNKPAVVMNSLSRQAPIQPSGFDHEGLGAGASGGALRRLPTTQSPFSDIPRLLLFRVEEEPTTATIAAFLEEELKSELNIARLP
jgi:hypothetical protein